MDNDQPTRQIAELQQSVAQLRQMLRRIQAEREVAAKRRRRRLLGIGVGISVLAHLILLVYFATVYRETGEGLGDGRAYEVAILPTEHLSDADDLNLDELEALESEALEDPAADSPAVLQESSPPAAELQAGAGELPTLAGAGESAGEGMTGSGGAGAASFFGVEGRGTRFAYIVDRSGSMMHNDRMMIAMRELTRSIQALPDYTYFTVYLFSSDVIQPDGQRGWMPARRGNVRQVTRWLQSVTAGGGTLPQAAFMQVFSMDVRPDVIFFMTDGLIPAETAGEIASLNQRGKRVVVNTIAFGEQGSEDLLRQIARESGGNYRYVPEPGGRR